LIEDGVSLLSNWFRRSRSGLPKTAKSEEFDEGWYISFYKDVGAAVARGEFASGLDHYVKHGRSEHRLSSPARSRDVWSISPEQRAEEAGWYWMAHPLVQKRINTRISGHPDCDAYRQLARVLASRGWLLPIPRAVSLGCGFGALERSLTSRGIVSKIKAYDFAEAAITEARRLARQHRLRNVTYHVADLEQLRLSLNSVDTVFAHQSIHHVEGLESLFSQIHRALKPGGIFHLHEFVGPSRFQWTDAQLALVNEYLSSLPPRLRRLPSGVPKPLVQRPTIEAMIAADPTEAVRSSEILVVLRSYFTIVDQHQIGGALLHLALGDIAQNFDPDEPEDTEHLRRLFALEDHMMDEGVIESDFVVVTAGRK
jgi:SAM-dependent methyltransferase